MEETVCNQCAKSSLIITLGQAFVGVVALCLAIGLDKVINQAPSNFYILLFSLSFSSLILYRAATRLWIKFSEDAPVGYQPAAGDTVTYILAIIAYACALGQFLLIDFSIIEAALMSLLSVLFATITISIYEYFYFPSVSSGKEEEQSKTEPKTQATYNLTLLFCIFGNMYLTGLIFMNTLENFL